MPSIRQNAHSDVLPDFRNLGVIARGGGERAAIAAALFAAVSRRAPTLRAERELLEPLLLAVSRARCGFTASRRLAYWQGAPWCSRSCSLAARAWQPTRRDAPTSRACWRSALRGGAARLLPPARQGVLAGAHRGALQALQARIRPLPLQQPQHGALAHPRDRSVPARARGPVGLFRTLMSEPRQFVHLAEEIALLERYALEQLRLGERLKSPGSSTRHRSMHCCRRCSAAARERGASWRRARHQARHGAGAHRRRGDRVLARIRTRTSRSSSAAPATAWRSTTSATAAAVRRCRGTSTPPPAVYRVEIEMPYRTGPA